MSRSWIRRQKLLTLLGAPVLVPPSWGAKIGAPNRRNGGENMDTCVDWRLVSIHAKVLLLSRVDCRLCRPAPKLQSQGPVACLRDGEISIHNMYADVKLESISQVQRIQFVCL